MKKTQTLNRMPGEKTRRARKSLRLIRAVCVVCMTVLCTGAFAGGGEIQEETVVSLVWEDRTADVETSWWNERSVHIHTEDVGTGGGTIRDYVGVTLSDLMELAGADGCAKAIVKSTDGLTGEVSAEDMRNYDIALVNGYAGGKPIKAGEGGPLKIVFPVTEHPEL